MYETVTLGRSKRSTAGNRMRELLEQAHKEQQEDTLFAEEEDDTEFVAPLDQKDVFLEEFADTDEEIDDEEAEERQLQREERRKAKKGKATAFNPVIKQSRAGQVTLPPADALSLLDPSIDPSKMAPSTLILEIRKQKREAKRLHRNEFRRSTMRASTLRTEQDLIEKERQEKEAMTSRKGRRSRHETGEVRGARPMTQDELIAAALEEEERNKEALTNWLRREEEKRELRRVGRKRVVGPRWTWVSRTVGRLVEVVGEGEEGKDGEKRLKDEEDKDGEDVKMIDNGGEGGRDGAEGDSRERSKDREETAEKQRPSSNKGQGDSVQDATKELSAPIAEPADPPANSTKAESSRIEEKASEDKGPDQGDNSDKTSGQADVPEPKDNVEPTKPTPSGAEGQSEQTAPADKPLSQPDQLPASELKPLTTPASETTPDGDVSMAPAPSSDSLVVPGKPVQPTATETPAAEKAPGSSMTGESNVGPRDSAPSDTGDATPAPAPPSSGTAPVVGKEPVVENADKQKTPPSDQQSDPAATPSEDAIVGKTQKKTEGQTEGQTSATPAQPQAVEPTPEAGPSGPYTRNYLILSEVPGGLPAELKLILGDHVDWDDVKVIPARNRPINRRPPLDLTTNTPAKYRHPGSMLGYSSSESYKTIEALLAQRYVWSEGGWWAGGEGDMAAEGVEDVPGWKEACARGWLGGKEIVEDVDMEIEAETGVDVVEEADGEEGVVLEKDTADHEGEEEGAEEGAETEDDAEEEEADDEEPQPKKRKTTKGKTTKGKGKAPAKKTATSRGKGKAAAKPKGKAPSKARAPAKAAASAAGEAKKAATKKSSAAAKGKGKAKAAGGAKKKR